MTPLDRPEALAGRVAVITGAGRGLGAALAIELSARGMTPVLCGRSAETLAAMRATIRERTGIEAPIVELDLAEGASVDRAAETVAAMGRPVDLLVNNGAMWLESAATPPTADAVFATVNSAIAGTLLFTQRLMPLLLGSEGADVVTIGSVSGLPNAPLHNAALPFYAAKRGQAAVAEGLRQQLRGTSVRSIIVHPPWLDDATPGATEWDAAPHRTKGARATTRDVVEAVLFAITRPRHVTLDITIDADAGGLFG
jgi:NADP-dependent 3-hydroxy acid dehydrogenase YdfG